MNATYLFKLACETTKKWGMMLTVLIPQEFEGDIGAEVEKATLLSPGEATILAFEGELFLFFADEEKCRFVYEGIVGDDGPTKRNSYNGLVRVHAVTCDSEGHLRSENT